jgi:hypothetical protein
MDEPKALRCSIIGTSGRLGLMQKLDAIVYDRMISKCKTKLTEFVESEKDFDSVILVSGGAALSDHVAVELFLQDFPLCSGLILYLPCEWDFEKQQFRDTGVFNWKTNPGGTLNYYHRQFSQRFFKNSLLEIDMALKKGARYEVFSGGFFSRNNQVSVCDYMIAFGTSDASEPKSGGTKYTWGKADSKTRKFYVNIFDE